MKQKKVDLRKLAKGMPCFIRCPNECSGNPETVVACHVRLIGISGAGLKSPDLFIAFGCHRCHQVCDGQVQSDYGAGERRQMLIEGCLRTQYWLVQNGFIQW